MPQKPMTPPELVGEPFPAVACILGCSVETVRRLVHRGSLDVVKLTPKRVLVTRESIDRFVQGRAS